MYCYKWTFPWQLRLRQLSIDEFKVVSLSSRNWRYLYFPVLPIGASSLKYGNKWWSLCTRKKIWRRASRSWREKIFQQRKSTRKIPIYISAACWQDMRQNTSAPPITECREFYAVVGNSFRDTCSVRHAALLLAFSWRDVKYIPLINIEDV